LDTFLDVAGLNLCNGSLFRRNFQLTVRRHHLIDVRLGAGGHAGREGDRNVHVGKAIHSARLAAHANFFIHWSWKKCILENYYYKTPNLVSNLSNLIQFGKCIFDESNIWNLDRMWIINNGNILNWIENYRIKYKMQLFVGECQIRIKICLTIW